MINFLYKKMEQTKIKRNTNYSINKKGEIRNDKSMRILKQFYNKKRKNAYKVVKLYENNVGKTIAVHRLMAETYKGHSNSETGLVIDHDNDNKFDNSFENLNIVTQRDNVRKYYSKKKDYVGVSYDKDKNKYRARIQIKNKSLHIGYYNTKEEAILAHKNKMKEII